MRRLPSSSLRRPSITVSTAGSAPGGSEAVQRLTVFARELAERLDAEVGPALPERA